MRLPALQKLVIVWRTHPIKSLFPQGFPKKLKRERLIYEKAAVDYHFFFFKRTDILTEVGTVFFSAIMHHLNWLSSWKIKVLPSILFNVRKIQQGF